MSKPIFGHTLGNERLANELERVLNKYGVCHCGKDLINGNCDCGDEEDRNQRAFFHGQRMKKAMRVKLVEMLEDYINEGEHQDGDEYWTQFTSVDKAIGDFALAIRVELES